MACLGNLTWSAFSKMLPMYVSLRSGSSNVVVLNGTIAEVSDIGKSLPLCAANISMFGNGEVANRD
jgi:hypothetical protein